MKIVVNRCFGGFSLSDLAVKLLGLKNNYDEVKRTDERLISLIESGVEVSGQFADLRIKTIPNTTTDWEIDNYDGMETIIYVVDGKLHRA